MSISNPIDQLKQNLHTLDYFDALVQQYLINTVGVDTDKYGVPAAVEIHYDGGTYTELTSTFSYLGREFTLHIFRNEALFKVTVEGEENEYEVKDTGRLTEEILDFFFDYEDTIKEVLPHFEPADINPRTVFEGSIAYTGTYRGTPVDIIVDPAKNTWHARLGEDLVTDECDVGSQKIFYQAEKIVDRLAQPKTFPGCSPRTGKTYVNDIRHLLDPANVVFVLEDTEFDPDSQSLTYHGTIDGVNATFTIVENVPMEVNVTFLTDNGTIVGAERVTGNTHKAHMDAIPALVSRTKAANEAIAAHKSARIKDLPEKKNPLTLEERIARLEKLHNID